MEPPSLCGIGLPQLTEDAMNILWIIVIGFLAGVVARFLAPGPNNPQGFILTTILGIVGAFLATFIGQTVGWYRLDQGAGLIGAVVGAVVVLFIWHRLVVRGVIQDPGSRRWL
jgi:uncharacterized membrane protein YeaQ/YmgE (transglycosylase-associated protein family)